MKRSDMLEILSDAVQPCNSTYKTSRDKTAERILDIMEKAGMLAPNYKSDYTLRRSTYYTPNDVANEFHKWEEEND